MIEKMCSRCGVKIKKHFLLISPPTEAPEYRCELCELAIWDWLWMPNEEEGEEKANE